MRPRTVLWVPTQVLTFTSWFWVMDFVNCSSCSLLQSVSVRYHENSSVQVMGLVRATAQLQTKQRSRCGSAVDTDIMRMAQQK